jgi:hypothetical protein
MSWAGRQAIEVFRTKAKLGKGTRTYGLVPFLHGGRSGRSFIAFQRLVVDREVELDDAAWHFRLDRVLLRGGLMRLMPYSHRIR